MHKVNLASTVSIQHYNTLNSASNGSEGITALKNLTTDSHHSTADEDFTHG
jgi:hypothetical protein